MGWLERVTEQRARANAPRPRKSYAPWWLRVERFLDRKAIKEAEATLTPEELAMFRQTRNVGPWRDAYNVIMQERAFIASGGPERIRGETELQLDASIREVQGEHSPVEWGHLYGNRWTKGEAN